MPDHSETGEFGEPELLNQLATQLVRVLASNLTRLNAADHSRVVIQMVHELTRNLDQAGHAQLRSSLPGGQG